MAKPLKDKEDNIFYEAGKTYEITINPRNQHMNACKNRLALCQADMSHIVDVLSTTCTMELYTELSEPTYGNRERGSESRVHYHGTLMFKKSLHSVGLFLLTQINALKKVSDYSINPHRPNQWQTYCTKQSHIMEPLCKIYKVPYKIETNKTYNPKFLNEDGKEGYFDRYESRGT